MRPPFKIKEACAEKLEIAPNFDRGFFCKSCSKNVLNLKNFSETEILKLIQNSAGTICGGYFKNEKTQRNLNLKIESFAPIKNRKGHHFSKIAAGVSLSILLANSISAQSRPDQSIDIQNSSKKPIQKTSDGNMLLSGKLLIEGTKKPMQNSMVAFITTEKIYKSKTNSKGVFNIEVPESARRAQNLIYIVTNSEYPNHKLQILSEKDLANQNIFEVKEESGMAMMYGEVGVQYAYKNSLVFLNGKKLDYKLFNKSYMVYGDQYDVYYIPQEFVSVFTVDKSVEDVFITFPKEKF